MSRTNETLYINKNNETNESLYHILWLVMCACKYRLNKGRRDDRFIWNPSTFERKCDKSCGIWEYLDYANFKYSERLIDKLADECNENIDGDEMIYNATLYDYKRVCKPCTLKIVLLIITFIIIMGISGACFYFYWHK